MKIDNPAYKGVWQHPEIDNPEYAPDAEIYLRKEISTIGFDLWQVKSGTIFGNVLITDDVDLAKKAAAGVKATQEGEKKAKDAQDEEERKKAEAEAKASGSAKDEDDEDLDDEEDDNTVIPTDPEEHDEL